MSRPQRPWPPTIPILAGITLIGLVLRLAWLGDRPLWLDELWTMELATGRGSAHLDIPFGTIVQPPPATTQLADAPPWYSVWTNITSATHPPLYFVVLRVWENVFGSSEAAVRSLSVACSLIAMLFLFDVARLIANERVALWAAAIFALAGPQVEYARETRNYAILIAFALAAASALVRIEKRGASCPRLAALCIAVLCTMLTHYLAAGAVAAVFVYALIALRGRDRLRTIGAFLAAGAVWILVWGPFLLRHATRFSGRDPTTEFLHVERWDAMAWSQLVLAVPARMLLDSEAAAGLVAIIAVIVAYLVPIPLLKRRHDVLLGWLWLIGVTTFVASLDVIRSTKQLTYARYFLLAGPGCYLLFATVGDLWNRWAKHLLPAAALLVCLLGLPRPLRSDVPDWRSLAWLLDENAGADATLVFTAPGKPDWAVGYMYLALSHYSQHRPAAIVLLRGPPDAKLVKEIGRSKNVWLIDGSAPAGGLPATCSPLSLAKPASAPVSTPVR